MNAVLGMDRLPTGIVPLTSVITNVRYGTSERVLLDYYGSGLRSEAKLEDLPQLVTEKGNPGNVKRIRVAEIQGEPVFGQTDQQITPRLFILPSLVRLLILFGSDELPGTDQLGQTPRKLCRFRFKDDLWFAEMPSAKSGAFLSRPRVNFEPAFDEEFLFNSAHLPSTQPLRSHAAHIDWVHTYI